MGNAMVMVVTLVPVLAMVGMLVGVVGTYCKYLMSDGYTGMADEDSQVDVPSV